MTLTKKEREDLRRSLKSRLRAGEISRMSKTTKQKTLNNMQEKLQKELGADFDLEKAMNLVMNPNENDSNPGRVDS